MNERANIEALVQMFVSLIENQSDNVTIDSLQGTIKKFVELKTFGELDSKDIELIEKRILARVQVVMAPATVIIERSWKPWLNNRRHEIDDYYWDRYQEYLRQIKKTPRNVLLELDESTRQVLDLTYDPKADGPWDRRGLVMGNVQSGKTQHYAGLIAKAADAGYKIIIVIAGVHNNLRNQTQERIDEGFIGARWTGLSGSRTTDVGVSLIGTPTSRRPASFTGSIKDFNKDSARSVNLPLASLREPAVFVVKKNTKTLDQLIDWLRDWNAAGHGLISEPLLLIDDEADNASIDVSGKKGTISRINKQIRQLLALFERSSYVGYTATPFANIFIDPKSEDEMVKENLFPRSFIIDLDPPSNYLGPQKMFLWDQESYLRPIRDNEAILPLSHKIDLQIESLPPSLLDAISVYLLSRAIRVLRKDDREHSAMMINVSRFNNVQDRVQVLVDDELTKARNAIKAYSALGDRAVHESSVLKKLFEIFKLEYSGIEFSWQEVLSVLHTAVSPIDVVLVNMKKAGDPLKYDAYKEHGRHVIAVGGLSLSRGLTIEGLTVSYFLRNSKMYDTLLQMGRWFGYRNHYEDLVRVYMPEESIDWYEYVTESIQELRTELKSMAMSQSSPEDFGLKVRRHPATLMITARNKFGRFERIVLSTSFGNRLVETVRIRTNEIQSNLVAVQNLSKRIIESSAVMEPYESHLEVKGVDFGIVFEFLTEFKNSASAQSSLATELVLKYLTVMKHAMPTWDLSIPSPKSGTQDKEVRQEVQFLNNTFKAELRTPHYMKKISDGFEFHVSSKQRVSSRGIEKFCLDEKLIEEVISKSSEKNIADSAFRAARQRPMLMIHFIQPLGSNVRKGEEAFAPDDLIHFLKEDSQVVYPAWGISFPNFSHDLAVESEYHVNATWIENEYGAGDLAIDEDEEDDVDG